MVWNSGLLCLRTWRAGWRAAAKAHQRLGASQRTAAVPGAAQPATTARRHFHAEASASRSGLSGLPREKHDAPRTVDNPTTTPLSPALLVARSRKLPPLAFWPQKRGLATLPEGRTGPQQAGGSASLRERNVNFGLWAFAGALAAMALAYGSVPLYRMFCQVTGYGGTVQTPGTQGRPASDDAPGEGDAANAESQAAARRERMRVNAAHRPIRIRFNADVSPTMPLSFVPRQIEMAVLPGETALAFYTAHNKSDQDVIGVATYNVMPAKAGIYFNKIQCFCFEEQRLRANEKIDMPVFFFLDKEFAEDPRMADVDSIILSYTFFRAADVSPQFLAEQQAKIAAA
ncbi:hypothetical protein CDCA_CDCA14G3855 [Cyanidium caldarium]|uniref:Uncharacterized protein n=1 Tax=Cyanidium caldarium TaxID=2771 RepID=A0AAV9IZS3_CYACA|nr:hypothetical protein CDCA_CDCA14G3855 [Cyanidium caldarium]